MVDAEIAGLLYGDVGFLPAKRQVWLLTAYATQ